jgi:tetratricopeptide (TPR) repeat protein
LHFRPGHHLAVLARGSQSFVFVRQRVISPRLSCASKDGCSTEKNVHLSYELRDYPSLIEASRRGVLSDPNDWFQHYFLGVGYEGTGKLLDAISEYQKAIEMSDGDQGLTVALAHAYLAAGKKAEGENLLRDLERESKSAFVSPYMIATIYAGLGQKDRAFEFLEKAYLQRALDLTWFLKADPRIDSLRSDPRFQSLLHRVGLSA